MGFENNTSDELPEVVRYKIKMDSEKVPPTDSLRSMQVEPSSHVVHSGIIQILMDEFFLQFWVRNHCSLPLEINFDPLHFLSTEKFYIFSFQNNSAWPWVQLLGQLKIPAHLCTSAGHDRHSHHQVVQWHSNSQETGCTGTLSMLGQRLVSTSFISSHLVSKACGFYELLLLWSS